MDWLEVFEIDLTQFAIPGSCLEGGIKSLLLVQSIVPMLLVLVVFVVTFAVCIGQGLIAREPPGGKGNIWTKGLVKALPPVLFSTFCLCAPTASAIFKTWDCVEYVDDSFVSTNDDSDTLIWDRAGTRFLRGDLRTTCNTFNGSETTMPAEYTNTRNIAWVFAIIYSIILPCIFMGLLLPSHKALRQRRSTQLVRATDFLHREYRPEYFCAAPRGSNPGLAAQTCTQV